MRIVLKSVLVSLAYLMFMSPAMGRDSRFYDIPSYNGIWFDSCVVEYGNANCSNWALELAASKFCTTVGYQRAASFGHDSTGNSRGATWRWTIGRRDGVEFGEFQYCPGCSAYLKSVDCVRD